MELNKIKTGHIQTKEMIFKREMTDNTQCDRGNPVQIAKHII